MGQVEGRALSESLTRTAELYGLEPGVHVRHYSGKRYSVVCVALREADHEPVVVYRAHYAPYLVWCRTVEEFTRLVACDDGPRRRFEVVLPRKKVGARQRRIEPSEQEPVVVARTTAEAEESLRKALEEARSHQWLTEIVDVSKPPNTSAEQMVRDLLEQAIADRFVAPHPTSWTDADPQIRTAGELAGTANLLADMLRRESRAMSERWQRAVGKSLEQAEEEAAAEDEYRQRRDKP